MNEVINCYFALSKVCNLRCSYCYVPEYNKADGSNYNKEALGAGEAFLEKARQENQRIERVVFHGAEPTILSPEVLGELINMFYEYSGGEVRSQSNGTRYTPDYLDRLLAVIEDPKKYRIGISMDGSANIHDPNRQNTWDLIFRNITHIKKRGFAINILSVVTPLTLEHLKDFSYWVEYMEAYIAGRTFKIGEHDIGLAPDEKRAFAKWAYETKNLKWMHAFRQNLCKASGNDCFYFEFDTDGNCYSCNKNFNAEGVFANWKTDSFAEIIDKRRGLYAGTPLAEECSTCIYLELCNGGCPLTRENDKSSDCEIKHHVYDALRKEGIDVAEFFAQDGMTTQEAIVVSAFPGLCALLGPERSRALVAEFLAVDPWEKQKEAYTYRRLVGEFHDFIQGHPSALKEALLEDLADFEMTRHVLLSESGSPGDAAMIETLHEGTRVAFHPRLVVKRYRYDVTRISSARQEIVETDTPLILFRRDDDLYVSVSAVRPILHHIISTALQAEADCGVSIESVFQTVASCYPVMDRDRLMSAVKRTFTQLHGSGLLLAPGRPVRKPGAGEPVPLMVLQT